MRYSPNKEIVVGEGGSVETSVVISSPADNSSFDAATGFKVIVDASHPSGFDWMRLWVDSDNIDAYVYNVVDSSPWEFDVAGLEAGIYTLHVRAGDNDGGKTDSEKITVTLTDDGGNDSDYYIDDCDALTGWNSHGDLNLNTTDHQQGDGCIAFTGDGTEEFSKAFSSPHDIQGAESDLMLEFWYYISDPTKINGSNQVELGSGGEPDVDEYNWGLEGLTSGWNHIQLNLSEAGKTGTPDLSAINWFRFYSQKSGSVTTMIDGIKISGADNVVTNVFGAELKSQNVVSIYPNPVYDNNVSVEFALESSSEISLMILDINGSIVSRPFSDQAFEPGAHKLDVPLVNIIPGTYFMKITFDDVTRTHKIVVM